MSKVDPEIDSLYVTRTYGGFLEGTYQACNEYLRKKIPEQAKRLWGDRPLHVVWPETEPNKKWPTYTYYAWLDDQNYEDEFSDGRELVLVWFSDEPVREVSYDIEEILSEADFEKYAKGYGF